MLKVSSVIFAAAAALLVPAQAEIAARQSVEKEVVTRDASGNETRSRVAAETVTPGETVVYTLHFKNDSAEPAEEMVLVMPVPAEVSYIEGSIEGTAANISFSADGGATYVTRGRLTVIENGVARPAKGDEITHIKWSLAAPVAPNGEGSVSYKGVLR